MVLSDISEALEKRRTELIDMLESNRDSIELEKQHQIYGAINEIDLFLHTIDFYQSNIKEEAPLRLAKPPEEKKGLFSTLFRKTTASNQ